MGRRRGYKISAPEIPLASMVKESINFTVHLTGVLRTVLSVERPPLRFRPERGLPIEKRMERLFLGITVTSITLVAMALILMFMVR